MWACSLHEITEIELGHGIIALILRSAPLPQATRNG